ncbi:MAG: ABC transporter ATP-binding protein [Phycisphaerae bacterium]|nr:ABC transporter ATP-binding protein [Planctomycetota bacterium]MBL7219255.1 ABC transporter ATP-binding protein [Phycisphaerae bacterium]
MLDIREISKTYTVGGKAVAVLDGMSLRVGPGEFMAVQGQSGCGKSTLLLAAGGLLRPDSGQVFVSGSDPYELSSEARADFRATHIGFVFQQFHLVPYLDVLDNVLSPSMAHDSPDARPRAMDLIEHFGLADRIGHLPGELSTGERQRTALARALLNRPKLLLADEPTGNLDANSGAIVLNYMREFAASGGAVLMVTHDSDAAGKADRVIQLAKA